MKSATLNNKIFATTPKLSRPRSTFRRTSDLKTAFFGGTLVPIYVDEVLPGDTFHMVATLFGRLATPLVPYMDNAYLETFWFYCPNRLLWTNFVKQQGEQDNPGDSTAYLTPILSNFSAATQVPGNLYDLMGHPVVTSPFATPPTVTSLHFRMYNKIWNEWFRDQNLQNSVPVPTGDGPDDYAVNFNILRINKFHDYFTSLLPWPQKGTAPTMSLGGSAPVWGSASTLPTALGTQLSAPIFASYIDRASSDGNFVAALALGNQVGSSPNTNGVTASGDALTYRGATTTGSGNISTPNVSDAVFLNETLSKAYRANAVAPFSADLSQSIGFTLNAFREFVATQRFMEVSARGGTRYNEGIMAHFGVLNPDNRVNRTLFLGSSRQPLNVQQVAQTSETGSTPQGNLAAYGTMGNQVRWMQSFNEHGYIIGLATVRADLHYQQNLERMFTRRTQLDYYTPEFANIGEQAVLNSEINFTGNSATDDAVLGYAERWSEYRFKNSLITSLMRSVWPTSLDFWHLAQDFGGVTPTLGSSFITEDAPWDRVLAVTSEPEFILNAYFENNTTRVMPVRSIPGLTRI